MRKPAPEDNHHKPETQEEAERHYPQWLTRLRLPQSLAIVICAAALMVVSSYSLYWYSEDRKYDIARPDQDNGNQELDVTELEEDTTRRVGVADIQRKIDFLRRERTALAGMNSLDVENLSDQNLQLVPSSNPSF